MLFFSSSPLLAKLPLPAWISAAVRGMLLGWYAELSPLFFCSLLFSWLPQYSSFLLSHIYFPSFWCSLPSLAFSPSPSQLLPPLSLPRSLLLLLLPFGAVTLRLFSLSLSTQTLSLPLSVCCKCRLVLSLSSSLPPSRCLWVRVLPVFEPSNGSNSFMATWNSSPAVKIPWPHVTGCYKISSVEWKNKMACGKVKHQRDPSGCFSWLVTTL